MSDANPGSWQELYAFRQRIDDLLEGEQEAGRDLDEVLVTLQASWTEAMCAEAARMELFGDQDEDPRTLDWGTAPEGLGEGPEGGWFETSTGRAYRASLDVHDEVLGTVTAFFGETQPPFEDVWVERYTEAFAEQIDNHVYQERTARRQHRLSVKIQRCLETAVFEEGLDAAVEVMMQNLPVKGFLLLSRSTHVLYPERITYRAYAESGEVILDGDERRDPELEKALENVALADLDVARLPGALPRGEDAPVVLPLTRRGREEVLLGKMVVWLQEYAPRRASTATAEILSACVMQRLADYSRETRNLQRYFAPRTVNRLLRTPDYQRELLAPRVETIGILFVDVAGFTSLSEQILVEPALIGEFVDVWSEEVTRVLLRHGGVMDKLIGDCLLGLFGPPFYEQDETNLGAAAVRAALEIREATRALISAPQLAAKRAEIEASKNGLDVSTGVNLASAAVGVFGSNEDFTAFSSGMNNAARLQSLAKPGQTLVTGDLADLLRDHPEACVGFGFGEAGSTPVKNVAEPLRWVEVLPE